MNLDTPTQYLQDSIDLVPTAELEKAWFLYNRTGRRKSAAPNDAMDFTRRLARVNRDCAAIDESLSGLSTETWRLLLAGGAILLGTLAVMVFFGVAWSLSFAATASIPVVGQYIRNRTLARTRCELDYCMHMRRLLYLASSRLRD